MGNEGTFRTRSKNHKIDIKKLEEKITSISDALAKLSNADDFRKLIIEWRRPGWTTHAEFLLVSALVNSMEGLTKTLTNQKMNSLRQQGRHRGLSPSER